MPHSPCIFIQKTIGETMTKAFLHLCLIFASYSCALAWVNLNQFGQKAVPRESTHLNAVETISLSELQNHEEDGSRMAESVTKWLDQEWMPQQVHIDMAECAKKSYISCREAGRDDVMDILMRVSDDLSDNWEKYDADSFVNAWDVANYVADYLTKASGNEGCECSEAIL